MKIAFMCIICCAGLANTVFADEIITQVVGQAGDEVITSRQVQINFFVEAALFPEEKSVQNKLTLQDKRFDKEVTRVLIESVVAKEAEVFNAARVPEDDLQKAMAVVKSAGAKSDNSDYWEKLAPSPAELKETVGEKLRAKKFVQFKTRASVVPVTEAEALQYFQKNRIRFGNAPFTQFKESIKSYLAQEQANTRIRDWFELLQKKYRVRKIASGAPRSN